MEQVVGVVNVGFLGVVLVQLVVLGIVGKIVAGTHAGGVQQHDEHADEVADAKPHEQLGGIVYIQLL